jgi:hypothetical protein
MKQPHGNQEALFLLIVEKNNQGVFYVLFCCCDLLG